MDEVLAGGAITDAGDDVISAAQLQYALTNAAADDAEVQDPAGTIASDATAARKLVTLGNVDQLLRLNPAGAAEQELHGILKIDGHYPQVGFDTLTLNVDATTAVYPDPTLDAPADPIGDSNGTGQPFKTLGDLMEWLSARMTVRKLTINIKSDTVETKQIQFSRLMTDINLSPTGNPTLELQDINFGVHARWVSVGGDMTLHWTTGVTSGSRANIGSTGQLVINAGATLTVIEDFTLLPINISGGRLYNAGTLVLNSANTTGRVILGCGAGGRLDNAGTIQATNPPADTIQIGKGALSFQLGTLMNAVVSYTAGVRAETGSFIDPATNVRVCWGRTGAANAATGFNTITFTPAFTGNPYSVVITPEAANNLGLAGAKIIAGSETNAKVDFVNVWIASTGGNPSAATRECRWVAIGPA
jgi:hypothetical protein